MRVREAKQVARDWVLSAGRQVPGFAGAYFAGSVNWLSDDGDLPPTSDLDVNVVIGDGGAPATRYKLVRDGVLLEVSELPADLLQTPEQVLAHFALAGGFRVPSIILDTTGHLSELQAAVARDFADPAWIRRRCEHARSHAFGYLEAIRDADPLHHQAILWLFGSSIPTLLPLIAGLRNPTVRRRYVAAREILTEYGHLDLYEQLLDQAGYATISRSRAEYHLAGLRDVFDVTEAAIRSPFPFATDISALARPLAIDGSRHLIERGLHREAVWWLGVTYSRCQTVLAVDAPSEFERFTPAYHELLADFGIGSLADMRRRAERVKAQLPEVWNVSEQIIAAH